MLTQEEDVELSALHRQGWTISAIARHLGRDRATIRRYLRGEVVPGQRRRARPDALDPYASYLVARFRDDPHVWATALFDEVVRLGYEGRYSSFTEQLRRRGLRPHCEPCRGVKGRPTIEIAHPAGEETQFDWVELPDAPWGGAAHLLVGALSHSSQARAVFADAEDQPHLVEALDAVVRRFGGTTRCWRFDRASTVVHIGTGLLLPSFAAVAKHYGVQIDICPPRRGNRKGVVEKAIHFITQRWWRTASVSTLVEAQASLDRFLSTTGDARERGERTVGELAAEESLRPLPDLPYPATLEEHRRVDAFALVAFKGNRYSVPPELAQAEVVVRHRLGGHTLDVVTAAGELVIRHRAQPSGAGATVRLPEHRAALETAVLAAFTTAPPCRRKGNRPPGPEALTIAAELLGHHGRDVVVDLGRYALLAEAAR